MILRLLRLTADLSDEPKRYYTLVFTVDKNATPPIMHTKSHYQYWFFHRRLRECFDKDYEHLFDVPQHTRTDNDVYLPTFQLPVDDATTSLALPPVKDFYRVDKRIVCSSTLLGSFDGSAVRLSNLKIIFKN